MTTEQALQKASNKLKRHHIANYRQDAEFLLSHILKISVTTLLTRNDDLISALQLNKYDSVINKRCLNIPLAYITNRKSFYKHEFFVDQNVLIPRPDTELLIEKAKLIIDYFIKPIKIADIGTGSGIIAITLSHYFPNNEFYATDISRSALKVAKYNAQKHNVSKRVYFFEGSLLEPLAHKNVDIILANLPYLTRYEILKNSPFGSEPLSTEPSLALLGGNDGLDIYRNFIQQISNLYNKPSFILLEIGSNQGQSISEYIYKFFPNSFVQIFKDLNDKDRLIQIDLR